MAGRTSGRVEKAEKEKREKEKALEKAMKRVEALEKDRPAPVLRIGSEYFPPSPSPRLENELII